MTINNFSITKDQYDHICYLIISSPTIDQIAIDNGIPPTSPEKVQRRSAILYIVNISKGKYGRIIAIHEAIDIAKKIQSKLGYKS